MAGDALVSTEWLAANLDAPDVRVVDGLTPEKAVDEAIARIHQLLGE